MRILVVSQYFWPESFRVNDLVSEFVARGHEVTVLTGWPNYPAGQVFPEFRADPTAYGRFAGARVVRVPLVPRGRGGVRLALNFLSFAASGAVLGAWKLRGQPFDAANKVALSVRAEVKAASEADRKAMKGQLEKFLAKKGTLADEVATRAALKMLGYLEASGKTFKNLFNTSGEQYRALKIGDRIKAGMSEDEAIALLAKNGKLVKRPFLLTDKGGTTGFDEATWNALV